MKVDVTNITQKKDPGKATPLKKKKKEKEKKTRQDKTRQDNLRQDKTHLILRLRYLPQVQFHTRKSPSSILWLR